jgi:hypothetical protein
MLTAKGVWYHRMLAFFLFASLTGAALAYEVLEMIPAGPTVQGSLVAGEHVSYSINPPRSIAIELDNSLMAVDLNGNGPLQLGGTIPVAGSQSLSRVLVNICTSWNLWHPYGGTVYQFRPDLITSNIRWKNYVLNLDVPNLAWGQQASISIIKASDYMNSQPSRIAITPAPQVELGPQAAMSTEPRPYLAMVTFPKVNLEWLRSTNLQRVRAGNVVLSQFEGLTWDEQNPNACYLGKFKIDLDRRLVYFMERDGTQILTALKVTIDDSSLEEVVYFEPDLWW